MAGGKNNLKEQMEILPEEHIKTQASQESHSLLSWTCEGSYNLRVQKVRIISMFWVYGSLCKIQVHGYVSTEEKYL